MKEDNWISVEDRLPEANELVVICFEETFKIMVWKTRQEVHFGKCVYNEQGQRKWNDIYGRRVYNVTHWQPLPEPPKN